MLLIGDIHITSRITDKVLTELRHFVDEHKDEQNIIFLGDYVYHFSYDRAALMALYHFFLELFEQKKNIYILAGNHDRLGNTFVFEEAKKAFALFKSNIHFITEPWLTEIEGEKIFFLPYFIHTDIKESTNKNENLSTAANNVLKEVIGSADCHVPRNDSRAGLTIIHHHYFNNTKCPGQKSLFHYKDVALREGFLDMEGVKFISGHLHQGFALKNYLCTGSVRSTSPLESNQNKYLFVYTPRNNHLTAITTFTNPYVQIEETGVFSKEKLLYFCTQIRDENKKNFMDSTVWKVDFEEKKTMNLKDVFVFLKVKNVDYEHMDHVIEEDLRKELKDVKLKKNMEGMEDLMKNFEISGKNLGSTFADRKEILKSYLQSKYGEDHKKYEQLLHEMKLL